MMLLDDEEEIMRSYIESEIYEATKEATQKAERETKMETAKRMLKSGKLTVEEIAEFSNLPIETVQQLADSLQRV